MKIVGSRVFVLLVRTERAGVARGAVDETVAHHFVFAFEAFSAVGARTSTYWTEVRAVLGVHICVRATVSLGGGFHGVVALTYLSRY